MRINELGRIAHRLLWLALAICILLPTTRLLALGQVQRDAIDSGAEYFNVDDSPLGCSATGTSSLNATLGGEIPNGATIYMLGDSITNQSRAEIETEMGLADLDLLSINADSGRAITYDSGGGDPTGLEAVEADSAIISEAQVVVVALGTNSGNEDLNVQIPALISGIRTFNADVTIFWVNTFYESATSRDARNATITANAATSNYRIIDTTSSGIELQSDGIHPTAAGNSTFANAVVSGINSGGSTNIGSPATGASYDPLSLSFPAFSDETAIAAAITDYIRERVPNSPWFGIDNNIGQWLVSESRTRGINPLLIMAIGKQENNFGNSSRAHVAQYFNYFGMKGSTPIDIPGSSYKGFSSPSEGITTFMDTVQRNTQGTERGQYSNVMNFYEYLGMHQAGSITYPGEPLDPNDVTGPGGQPDGDRLNGWDTSMEVYTSWDEHKNDGPPTAVEYRGNTYNPGIYFRNSIEMINNLTGLSLSEVPTRGGSTATAACSGGGGNNSSGLVDGAGYSFPLAPQTRAISGITVGQTQTLHTHDNTAAFDLTSIDSADVYAIYDGEATIVNTEYNGVSGCTTVMFRAADGFYYWYGHLKNPTIQVGVPVRAGDKIGEVADGTNFTTACYGGGPHLHIDRGCVLDGVPQTGGRDECRDPDFIAFLSSIYARLPNN